MSATDDVARMLTLVPWLLERPGASLTEVADAFGVDVATVRDDLGHLDFCGLPGLGGGDLFEVSIVGDRVVLRMADELRRPLRPTAAEALRLVLTVDSVAEALGDEVPALRDAVERIRTALGVPEHVADVVGDPGPRTLTACRDAIRTGRRLRLRYQGRADDEPRRRDVDPWELHVVDGAWYLQAHDTTAGGRRVFHLERVADVTVLDEPVAVPAPDDLQPPRYVPAPDDLSVILEVTPAARWIIDVVDVDEVDELDEGRAVITVRTDAPAWLAKLVLMAAGEARVRAPASFARRVATAAEAALRAYGPPP